MEDHRLGAALDRRNAGVGLQPHARWPGQMALARGAVILFVAMTGRLVARLSHRNTALDVETASE